MQFLNPKTTNKTENWAAFFYKSWEGLLLCFAAMIYLYIRSNFLSIPMERDEGIYAYFGRLITEGKTPYLDFYEMRFPFIFYAYAFLVKIFGDFEGLAFGISCLNVLSLAVYYWIAKQLFNQEKLPAFFAVFAMAILGLTPQISGYTRQSEHIVVFLASIGFLLLQKTIVNNKNIYLFGAGAFMCLAMLTKTNAVCFIVAGGLLTSIYYLFANAENSPNFNFKAGLKRAFLKGLVYSVGVFSTFGAMCLYMLYLGVFGEMWYWAVTYVANITQTKMSWLDICQCVRTIFTLVRTDYEVFWGFAVIGLCAYIGLPSKKLPSNVSSKLFVGLGFVAGLGSVITGFHFNPHYWLMFMPFVGLAFGAFFFVIQVYINIKFIKLYYICSFLLLSGVLYYHNHCLDKNFPDYYTQPNHFQITRKVYGENLFPETYEVGKFLKKIARPHDQIALIGSEPQLFIYTGLYSASRHAYFAYLTSDTTNTAAVAWQKEFYAEIQTQKPRFLVTYESGVSILRKETTSEWIFEKIHKEIIPQNYRRIAFVENAGGDAPVYVMDSTLFATHVFPGDPKNRKWDYIEIFERMPSK
jgi:hypothetical protein